MSEKLTDKKMDCLHDIYTSDCETCHEFDEECHLFDETCSKILPKAIKELIHRLQNENAEKKAEIELHKIQNSKFEDELSSLKRIVEILTKREFDEQRKTYLCGKCQERVFSVYKEKETQISELQKQVDDWVRVHDEQLSSMQVLTIEKKNLQKQVDELTVRTSELFHELQEEKRAYARAVKDTAKEILTELKNTRFHKGTLTYDFEMAVNNIAKKYGLEVE